MHSDQERIIQVLALVPSGFATSYGHVAFLAGLPRHARLVARVLRNLPSGSTIPWFRIVRSDRQPAFAIGSLDWHRQTERLQQDGITLLNNRVPLSQWLSAEPNTLSISASKARKSPVLSKRSRKTTSA